jgi:hypothetical protein
MNTQVDSEKKYDVAVSFLIQDFSLAQALYDKLSEGLKVFFFPRNQEELAGTEGLESMREPFLHQSRINLVLYREKWGNTPWTAVEAAAIKDSCLANAYRNLFFFVVEPTRVLPPWLPDTHVRFNYNDFPLEQAIGAIKARVQERGGHYTPLTPIKRAEILRTEDLYRRDKSRMSSEEGLAIILKRVLELFQEIERRCQEVNAIGHLTIKREITFQERNADQSCILTDDRVSMIVVWHQLYANTLDRSGLFVREFNGRMLFNSEMGHYIQLQSPDQISETQYEPELSRSRDYGWKPRGQSSEFILSSTLADKLVMQFMDLVERFNSGKIRKPDRAIDRSRNLGPRR